MVYEYLPKEDIYLIQELLPTGTEGFCKEVGAYRFAFVDIGLNDEKKREAAKHEIKHLVNGDLDKDFDELEEK